MEAPQNDLIRGVSPVRAENDGRTMVGYPIVYDVWTEIHSWEGDFLERIAAGAADKSIKQRGRENIKVQYNHGMHPVVGTSGLGRASVARSDKVGLYVEVPLADTSYNRDIIVPLLADGTLDGMSFRFSVISETWEDPKRANDHNPDRLPERTITELKLIEMGPVDWPAYEATQVGIRSAAGLSKWLQASAEERSQFAQRFGITAERRLLTVPGFDPPRDATGSATRATRTTTGAADTGTPDSSRTADPGTLGDSDGKRRRRRDKYERVLAARASTTKD